MAEHTTEAPARPEPRDVHDHGSMRAADAAADGSECVVADGPRVAALRAILDGHVDDSSLSPAARDTALAIVRNCTFARPLRAVPRLARSLMAASEDGGCTERVLVDVLRWVGTLD